MKYDTQLIGQQLLKAGFPTWFKYIFKVVEGTKFTEDKIHQDLFNIFDEIYNQKRNRVIINLPPRAGKSTMGVYLLAYTITRNPKSNSIYTSYSQSLLSDLANRVKNILTHPVYLAMYPSQTICESIEEKPIDDFWSDYLIQETGKTTFSSKKIITVQGGVTLFSSLGASITGFGVSRRNDKSFSGLCIIDDPQKPANINSETFRKKDKEYFSQTLLSRLNNPKAPIVLIAQKLHADDMSTYLEEKYKFYTVKKPLLDKNGVCQIASQYTPERIAELQIDNYTFQTQYQQQNIVLGGEVIKREWFNYYDVNFKYNYKKIVIATDTAMSTKESADRSCFMVGGITQDNRLHIIDFIVGRWDYPTLKEKAINLWNKWQLDKRSTSASALYVEEKASGIQILQEFKKYGIPLMPLKANKDKYTRVQEVLEYIASGMVYLPHNEAYGFNPEILNEVESFTRDNSHLHDDITDTLVHLINATIARKQVSILEVI